ncbi:MAG: hypothetical protein ACM3TR_09880 [Caulobacteraceae bacterium]
MSNEEILKSRFAYLNGLPTCNCSYVEQKAGEEVKLMKVDKFINGRLTAEGEAIQLKDSLEEAIIATDKTLKEIIASYKYVWLRIFPQYYEHDGKFYVYTRLAFCN